jgi:hypothetical protein
METEWVHQEISRDDSLMNRLVALRSEVQNHRKYADGIVAQAQDRDDLPYQGDEHLMNMLIRLQRAMHSEQERAQEYLASIYDEFVNEENGGSVFIVIRAEKVMNDKLGGGSLHNMRKIYEAMEQLQVLPYYENAQL